MSVTVLGCCGSYPGPRGACSGYLVQCEGLNLWLDAGSGTMANLQRHVDLQDVDAIILTHEHPDHWADIEGMRVACAYVLERKGVPVFSPAGVRKHIFKDFAPALDWRTVADGDRVALNGVSFSFSRTDHPPETLAVRIDSEDRSLAYSADTGPGWSFDRLGNGIDLALCEATYLAENEGTGGIGHLSARQAARMGKESGVGRLLLTHIWPTIDPVAIREEAAAEYGGPVDLAVMHQTYEV